MRALTSIGLVTAVVLGGAGCSGDTTLLVSVDLAGGRAQPDRVRVTLIGDKVLRPPSELPVASAGHHLPGTIFVGDLDPSTPGFRVLVDGLDAGAAVVTQAAQHVQLAAHANTRVTVTLDGPLPDGDGDGVPDPIDDCPTLPDPDQTCAGGLDLATPGGDLGAAGDLPDLTAPPDLSRPSCPPFAVFCDDFESGKTSKWAVDRDTAVAGTSVAISTQAPFRGAFALEAKAPLHLADGGDPSTYAYLTTALSLGTPQTVAVRAYVKTPSKPGPFELVLGLFDHLAGWAVGSDALGRWEISQDYGLSPDLSSSTPVPSGRWVCVELVVDYAPTPRVRLFTDGQPIIDAKPAGARIIPTELDVGLVRAPGVAASDAFVDDVALATQPIGCE